MWNTFKWINVACDLTCFQYSVTLQKYVIKATHFTYGQNSYLVSGFKFHKVSVHMAVTPIYSTLMAEADELCYMWKSFSGFINGALCMGPFVIATGKFQMQS